MKLSLHAFVLLVVQASVYAGTPPQVVDRIDSAREGNLPTMTANYYDAKGGASPCNSPSLNKTVAYKLSSSSLHESKKPGTLTNYEATYLTVRSCLSGSTFAGAYREVNSAAVIHATRVGVEDAKGVIVPSKADEFVIDRIISPDLLNLIP